MSAVRSRHHPATAEAHAVPVARRRNIGVPGHQRLFGVLKLFPALWSVQTPTDSLPRQPWTAEIGPRLRRYFPLKLILTTGLAWLFFIGYFYVLKHPAYAVTVMPLTALDLTIPFQPQWLFVYLSLWLYVGVGPGLQLTLAELAVYILWMGALCTTGLVCFYFWPTQVPPLTLATSDFPGFAMLRRVDAAGNACPSLHVAAAIFTAIRVEDLLRWARSPVLPRLLNVAWFAAIAYSTLAVKQHVVLDVLVGALFGVVFALPSLRWRPRRGTGSDAI
jgi:membrane-associated phospholipid phosphatase